jgi:hypothetical protein
VAQLMRRHFKVQNVLTLRCSLPLHPVRDRAYTSHTSPPTFFLAILGFAVRTIMNRQRFLNCEYDKGPPSSLAMTYSEVDAALAS